MADPDNLVLTHLQQIRADIAEMTVKLDEHGKRFDKLDGRLGPHDTKINNALRFAAMANLGAQNAEARVLEVVERQDRLEKRLEEVNDRLRLIEVANRDTRKPF